MREGFPFNWQYTSLNIIADWGSGGTPKATEPKYYNGDIPWLIITDLNNSVVTKSAKKITQLGYDNSSTKWVELGSVMIAMYGSIGKLGIAGIRCTTNQAIAFTTKIWGQIPTKYLFYYLKYSEPELLNVGQGGAQKNISQTILKQYPFPLPPLNEQKRIVAKLDAIMPRIEAVKARLDKVPTIIKRFRQSVLTAAVTGKLTEKWRLSACNAQAGEEHSDAESDISELNNDNNGLPESWSEIQFDKLIIELRNGVPLKPNINSPGTKILRISANRSGNVNLDDHRFLPDGEGNFSKFLLKEGDLLFTRYNGNIDLVGVCGKVRKLKENVLYPDKLMRVRIDSDFCDTDYLEYIFQTGNVREYIVSKSKTSAGQNGLSGTDLKMTPIPLPPLEEQKEIVRQVDKLFAMADKVEAQYKNAKERVDKLSQSVLAKAFRGELVPQDPNDLPAPQPGKWFIYVLECEDGSYYKGFTKDILQRWKQHVKGQGAEWTKKHPPVKLVHWEEFKSEAEAVSREKELKTGFGRKWLDREIKAGRTRQAGEPAEILLERIMEEKAKMEAELKAQKKTKKIRSKTKK